MTTYKLTQPVRGNLDIRDDGGIYLMSYPGDEPEFVWKASSLDDLLDGHPELLADPEMRKALLTQV
jgi:hypothetical protein